MSNVEGISSKTANQWSPALASLGSTLTTYLQDKMLKKIDVDENGTVGQSEFRAAMEQLTSKLGVAMEEDTSEMFAALDADGDGELSGNELGQLIRNVFAAPANTQDFLNARGDDSSSTAGFDALDTDGDGILSRAEYAGQTAHSALPGEPGSTVTTTTTITSITTAQYQPSAEAAASSTQQVAQSSDPLKALLGGLDANSDGQVSSSEVDQFIAQLAGQMQLALSQLRDNSSNSSQGGTSSATA